MNENTSATSEPDDAPLPSDEMLRLIDAQELRVRRHFEAAYAWVLIAWAAAWFIGFGALWSNTTGGGNPWFRLPQPWAWIIFAVTLAAAIVASIVVSVLSNRGVRGGSQVTGAMYGWAWSISMIAAWWFCMALSRAGLPDGFEGLLYPGVFITLVGVLYLAGGALWRDSGQYILGIVLLVLVVVATFVGAPTHNLIYATCGPLAMLVLAVLIRRELLPQPRVRA